LDEIYFIFINNGKSSYFMGVLRQALDGFSCNEYFCRQRIKTENNEDFSK